MNESTRECVNEWLTDVTSRRRRDRDRPSRESAA